MSWGLKNRLARIFSQKDGKTLMLAVDHGYFQGPTTGLENARKTIEPLLPYADSLMLTRGILRTSVQPEYNIPIVLRVSGGASILKELSNEEITTSMEEAIRLNASAVAVSIFVGAEYEKQSLMNLARMVDEGERYGIPVLAVTAVGRDMNRDARYLALACRIAAELGAHFVKTYYCEDFARVVNSCPVPVVIAGGKKTEEILALKLASSAIKDGAKGVDMGRNVFQSDSPVGMIKALREIIHSDATAEEAYETYLSERGERVAEKKAIESTAEID